MMSKSRANTGFLQEGVEITKKYSTPLPLSVFLVHKNGGLDKILYFTKNSKKIVFSRQKLVIMVRKYIFSLLSGKGGGAVQLTLDFF